MRSFRLLRGFGFCRHIPICLLALIMLARGVVPAGYMPSADAARDSKVEIVLCPSDHGAAVAVANGEDNQGAQGHGAVTLHCPFGIFAHQALDLPPALVVSTPVALQWVFLVSPLFLALAGFLFQGPPLGARAPPMNLD